MMDTQKGAYKATLEPGVHRINYALPFPALVSIGSQPVATIGPGKGKHVFRTYEPYDFEIDVTDAKTKWGLGITSKPTQLGEEFDDLPPPEPPAPDNYLQMMRVRVRQEMGIMREEFTRGRSPYEMGVIDTFEEDLLSQQKKGDALQAQGEGTDESDGSSPEGEGTKLRTAETITADEATKEPGNPR